MSKRGCRSIADPSEILGKRSLSAGGCVLVIHQAESNRSEDSMAANSSSNTITLKSSRARYAILLLCSLGFVAGGAFIVAHAKPVDRWIGWMNIVFFGAGIPLFIRQFVDARPRLVIDDRGIFDRTLGLGVIPWGDISGAYIKSIEGNHFICLELRDPGKWIARYSPMKRSLVAANEALGFTAVNLNLSGVAVEPLDVLEVVLKNAALHSSRNV